ncbi:hypothetical protein KFK09_028103 [Dendrobium nobile]|uniref:Uncharacterized protein n=1 Tax=Dendrobium nobile TaxID=94219 RepID=A0A8T3A0S8_DENNO|nr:hypothetical protein KFK09_028103 [Dendrobium nobile]
MVASLFTIPSFVSFSKRMLFVGRERGPIYLVKLGISSVFQTGLCSLVSLPTPSTLSASSLSVATRSSPVYPSIRERRKSGSEKSRNETPASDDPDGGSASDLPAASDDPDGGSAANETRFWPPTRPVELSPAVAGIRGNIASCKKVPHDIRHQMQENLREIGKKKQQTHEELEQNTTVFVDEHIDEEIGSSSLPKSQAFDAHHEGLHKGKRKKDDIDNFFAPRTKHGSQPSLKSVMASKEAIHRADLAKAVDAIAAIGPGYKLPSYHKLRVNILQDCKEEYGDVLEDVRNDNEIIGNEDIDAFGGECFDEQGFMDITFDASNLGDDF